MESSYGIGKLPGNVQTQLLVVPIIDCSESMMLDGNIDRVNEVMRAFAPQLVEIENDYGAEIILASISFSSGAKWIGLPPEGEPVRPADFVWSDLVASGGANLGAAYDLLRTKLAKRENGG